jgi:hypothetical protein
MTIIPLNKNFASYTARFHSVMTDTAGKENKMSFIETGTLVNRNGKSKLLCGQTSIANQ